LAIKIYLFLFLTFYLCYQFTTGSKTEVIEMEREQGRISKSEEPQRTQSRQADGPTERIEQQEHGGPVLPLPPALVLNAIAEYWPDIDLDEMVPTALPALPFTAAATASEAKADQSSSSSSVAISREDLLDIDSGADNAVTATAGDDDSPTCPSSSSSAAATAHADPNPNKPRLIKKRNSTGIMDKIVQVEGIKPSMQIPGVSIQAIDKNGVVVKSFANSLEFRKETHLRFDKINRVLEGKQTTAHGMRWRYYRGSDDQDVPPLPKSKRVRLRRKAVPKSVLGIPEDESEQEPEECDHTAPLPVPSLLETEIGAEGEDFVEMTEGDRGSESEPNSEGSGEKGERRERKREREVFEENGTNELEEGTERESELMSLVHAGETSHLSDGISNNSSSLDDYSHTLEQPDGVSVESIADGGALRAITDIGFVDYDHDCTVQEDLQELGFSDVPFAGYVT
jgi:hypothetical protein